MNSFAAKKDNREPAKVRGKLLEIQEYRSSVLRTVKKDLRLKTFCRREVQLGTDRPGLDRQSNRPVVIQAEGGHTKHRLD